MEATIGILSGPAHIRAIASYQATGAEVRVKGEWSRHGGSKRLGCLGCILQSFNYSKSHTGIIVGAFMGILEGFG